MVGKKVTFSEGAELLGVPISTISKWFSQGLFKEVELDRKGPGGGTYYLKLEELLAIKDALEAETRGLQMAQEEIAAAKEKSKDKSKDKHEEKKLNEINSKRKLSLVKATNKQQTVEAPKADTGKEIVLRIEEDTAAGLINTLSNYLNNFEQKFLQHMEQQADKNAVKYNSMAIQHLETLKDMSSKMERVVDALITMPQKVTEDTARVVQEIKESLPDLSEMAEANKGTSDKLDAVSKKLEKLSEEVKDTKWAVVKIARDHGRTDKTKGKNKKKIGLGFGGLGKLFGIGK